MSSDSANSTGLSRRQMLTRTAAAGGVVWVTPMVLASPAGAAAGSGILLDTMIIPTGSPTLVTSTMSLEAGKTYRLRGSGLASNGGAYPMWDVEYAYTSADVRTDSNGTVDYGVKFSTPAAMPNPTVPAGPGLYEPRWGAYDADDHVYEYLYTPTTSGPLQLFFEDTFYDDNNGTLTVEIFTVG